MQSTNEWFHSWGNSILLSLSICALTTGFFLLCLPNFIFHLYYILSIPSTEGWANISCDVENLKHTFIFFFFHKEVLQKLFCWSIGFGCCTERVMFWKESCFIKSELISHLYQGVFTSKISLLFKLIKCGQIGMVASVYLFLSGYDPWNCTLSHFVSSKTDWKNFLK